MDETGLREEEEREREGANFLLLSLQLWSSDRTDDRVARRLGGEGGLGDHVTHNHEPWKQTDLRDVDSHVVLVLFPPRCDRHLVVVSPPSKRYLHPSTVPPFHRPPLLFPRGSFSGAEGSCPFGQNGRPGRRAARTHTLKARLFRPFTCLA